MPARCATGSEDLEGARRTESDALDAVPFIHRLMVRSWKRGEGGDSWEAETLLHARAFGLTSRAGDTPPRLESRPFGLVWRSGEEDWSDIEVLQPRSSGDDDWGTMTPLSVRLVVGRS